MFDYFKRVKNSFVGVIFGCLMVPGSIALHAWNEYRTVHQSRGLAEASRTVETLPSVDEIQPTYNEKLVHLTGKAVTEETLHDPEFSVEANAIRLVREVEMYQWVEEKVSRDQNNSNQPPRYEYHREWSNEWLDSAKFNEPEGHHNPDMHYRESESLAELVHVGAYRLNPALQRSMSSWEDIDLNSQDPVSTIAEEQREHFQIRNNQLYWSSEVPNPEQPLVGDLRIQFRKIVPAEVSILAQQRSDTFGEYTTSNGVKIQRLFMGTLTAQEVVERLIAENNMIAWGLRFLGLILCVIGFSLILKPLSAIVSFLPVVGELTGALTFFISMLLGTSLSAATIGIAWIAVRPLLGGTLLVGAGAGIYLLLRMKRKTGSPQSAAPPPLNV